MSAGCAKLIVTLICLVLLGTSIRAEETVDDAKDAKSPPLAAVKSTKPKAAVKAAAKIKKVSPEREAELLEFVQKNHTELATLLTTLKTAQTKDYAAAISDLDREIRHLDQIRKRSPVNYDAELKVWMARSRVRLLSARMSMSEDEELKAELKSQLRELRQLETAALQAEIGSVQQTIEKQRQKLQKLQGRLADLQSSDEDWLAKQMASLEEKQQATEKPKKKPAAKQKKIPSATSP